MKKSPFSGLLFRTAILGFSRSLARISVLGFNYSVAITSISQLVGFVKFAKDNWQN